MHGPAYHEAAQSRAETERPMAEKERILILGGGMVAGYAAREFAERGAGQSVLIVSSDSVPPYERPPLSKGFLAGTDDEASVYINDPGWYEQQGVGLRLRTVVERIDTTAKRLRTREGNEIAFEKLLIATGSRPRRLDVPGGDLDGVLYLRSLDDAKQLRAAYRGAKKAVVLGSGFIGMEVASVLAQRGLETTMTYPEERVWERIFTPEMSAFFQRYYETRGVRFRGGELAVRFEGDGRVRAVVAKSGLSLDTDMAVAGIGAVPALEAVRDSGIALDNGVVVDEHLETSVPGIFAAGDVTNYPDAIFGGRRRVEHWDNAVEQAKHVARVMLGQRVPWVHVPYFFSDVFDLSYELWGDPAVADQALVRGDAATSSFSTWWLKDGVLVAAFVMNRPDEERDAAPAWIAEHRRVSADRLRDEARALAEAAEPSAA